MIMREYPYLVRPGSGCLIVDRIALFGVAMAGVVNSNECIVVVLVRETLSKSFFMCTACMVGGHARDSVLLIVSHMIFTARTVTYCMYTIYYVQ